MNDPPPQRHTNTIQNIKDMMKCWIDKRHCTTNKQQSREEVHLIYECCPRWMQVSMISCGTSHSCYGVITCVYIIIIIAEIMTYYTYLHKHSKQYIKLIKINHSIID